MVDAKINIWNGVVISAASAVTYVTKWRTSTYSSQYKLPMVGKKWRLGEVNIFENCLYRGNAALRKWSGFMCK